MVKTKWLFSLCLFLVICGIALVHPANAETIASEEALPAESTSATISLYNLLGNLIQNHDKVRQAQRAVNAAKKQRDASTAGWMPQFDASMGAGYTSSSVNNGANTKGKTITQSLTAEQLLWDFGGVNANIAMYDAVVDQNETHLAQIQLNMLLEGAIAYVNIIRSREMLKYANRSISRMERISGMEEYLVQYGEEVSYRELQAKAQLSAAESYKITVEQAMAMAKSRFKSIFNFEPMDSQVKNMKVPTFPEDFMPKDLQIAINTAVQNNLTLERTKHEIEQAREMSKKQEATLFPKITGNVGASRASQGASSGTTTRSTVATGINIEYEDFSGYGELKSTEASRETIHQLRRMAMDQRRDVEELVRNAWHNFHTMGRNSHMFRNQASITRNFLDQMKESQEMGGKVQLIDILVGERDYINATSASVAADIDMLISAYQLLYQIGTLKTDFFKQPL